MLKQLYADLIAEIENNGTPLGPLTETFGVHRDLVIPRDRLMVEYQNFKDHLPDYPWDQRLAMEKLHYNKLRYSLSHSFAENWFYKNEWVENTRRVIALSSDCISSISVYMRGPDMHLNVYFRSSHLKNLFPIDLCFILGLSEAFTEDLQSTKDTFDIPHDIPDWSRLHLHLSIGNLHF